MIFFFKFFGEGFYYCGENFIISFFVGEQLLILVYELENRVDFKHFRNISGKLKNIPDPTLSVDS